jgi:uncharacterized protein YxjI
MDALERFGHETYTVRRKILNFISTRFHIYAPDGSLAMFCRMKGFKLKEDIRLYTDEEMNTEVLTIRSDRIIDFSAAYTVVDPIAGESVGALRRAGFKSMLRDEWTLFDAQGAELGKLKEDSTIKAIARRLHEGVALFMPQKYHIESGGQTICTIQQNFNPFVMKVVVDFTPDTTNRLDPRLGLAAAVLMCAVEGKQG